MKSLLKTAYWNIVAILLCTPVAVSAQSGGGGSSGRVTTFENPIGFDSLQEFFAKFLEILVQIAFPFLVLAIIYTGFLFVKAQGSPDKINEAKRMLLWTVVGALIILGAAAISTLIQGTVDQIIR